MGCLADYIAAFAFDRIVRDQSFAKKIMPLISKSENETKKISDRDAELIQTVRLSRIAIALDYFLESINKCR